MRGSGTVDLGIALIAHACRENRRGGRRVSCDGRATGWVDERKVRRGADQHDIRCAVDARNATGEDPRHRALAGSGEDAMMMVDVVGSQAIAQQLLEEVIFFVRRVGRADAPNRRCPVLLRNLA